MGLYINFKYCFIFKYLFILIVFFLLHFNISLGVCCCNVCNKNTINNRRNTNGSSGYVPNELPKEKGEIKKIDDVKKTKTKVDKSKIETVGKTEDKVEKEDNKELVEVKKKFIELKEHLNNIFQCFYVKKVITAYNKIRIEEKSNIDEIKSLNNKLKKIIDVKDRLFISENDLPVDFKGDGPDIRFIDYNFLKSANDLEWAVIFNLLYERRSFDYFGTNYYNAFEDRENFNKVFGSDCCSLLEALLVFLANEEEANTVFNLFSQFPKDSDIYNCLLLTYNKKIKNFNFGLYDETFIKLMKCFGTSDSNKFISENELEFLDENNKQGITNPYSLEEIEGTKKYLKL